jgi:hypothetical protein
MEVYVIARRNVWRTPDELHNAVSRAMSESERMADVRWIRSYVLAESDGSLGTMCIFEATGPEAIRRHAYAAGWPVDEIVAIADTLVPEQVTV